ncbi:MAG: choice-of-anchor Q domain-containing protein [Chloroflexota bacterium]
MKGLQKAVFAIRLWGWLGCILVLVVASAPAATAGATTTVITVNSTADEADANPGDGLCYTLGGSCTLRAAVQEANALAGANTIQLPAGGYKLTIFGKGEDMAVRGDLDITGDLTISGAGAAVTVINGQGLVTGERVFHVLRPATVTLSGVTVSGGRASNGGGIYNEGTLNLTSVVLSANSATGPLLAGGGAIYNDGALVVRDSALINNSAVDRGGGVYNASAAATTHLVNTTVAYNTAGHGGGAFNEVGIFTLSSSTLTANSADWEGGGIYHVSAAVTARNTIWAVNSAGQNGPDCRGTVTSVGYNLLGNVGNTGACTFLTTEGDQVGVPGAVIDPLLGSLQAIHGSTPAQALLPGSPALDAGNPAGCADHEGQLLLADQRGAVRPADGDGDGAFVCDIGAAEFRTLTGPDFELVATPLSLDVCAPADAVYEVALYRLLEMNAAVTLSAQGQPSGVTVTFSPNPAIVPGVSTLTIGNTGAAAAGDYTIDVTGATPTATHTISVGLSLRSQVPFSVTLLSPADGATAVSRRPRFEWQAVSFADSYILEVAADAAFNHVLFSAPTSDLSRDSQQVLRPGTKYYWRVQAVNSCGGSLYSPVFSFTTDPNVNYTVNSAADSLDASLGDGLCAAISGLCTLRAAVEESNLTTGSDAPTINIPAGTFRLTVAGGAEEAAVTGDLDLTRVMSIVGAGRNRTTIDGNSAVTGDRVFHVRDSVRVKISGLTITGGEAANGGGIYNSGNLTLDRSTLSGNSATADFAGGGGGVYNDGRLIIRQTTFSENSAAESGGAIYNNLGSVTLNNSTVSGNSAAYGGGVYSLFGLLTLTRSTLSENTAGLEGAGIFASGSATTIAYSTLSANLAVERGGGVRYDGAAVNVLNSTISGNDGGLQGGGFYGSGSDLARLQLSSATIYNNTAGDGGGLYNEDGFVTLRNTILAGNSAAGLGPDCQGALTSDFYNLIGDASDCAFTASTGDQVGDGSAPIDPLLGPLQNNGGSTWTHALLAGSLAIEAGNPAGCFDHLGRLLTLDQRGLARTVDGDGDGQAICDAGAYELE